MQITRRLSAARTLPHVGLGVVLTAFVVASPGRVHAEEPARALLGYTGPEDVALSDFPFAALTDESGLPLPIVLPQRATEPPSGEPAITASTEAPPPAAPAQAQPDAGADASAADFAPAASEQADNAEKYCTNIADAAADARFARQNAAIAELEKQIEERIKALEAKRAEYEDWLTRREDFLRKADESVVAIFTQMRPDAASEQMSVMNMEAAAAILVKLNPRIASAILNEMDPTKAAQLTTTMAGLARPSDEEKTPG